MESAGRPTRFATCSLLDLLVIRFKQGRTFLTPQHVKTVFETGNSMPTLRFTRLSKPEVVRSIDPIRLLTLLKPHAEFLKSRGLTLPAPSKASRLDHQRLMPILMSPGEKTPPDLLDALSMIDQMSAPRAIDVVLDHLSLADLQLTTNGNHSPTDIVTQAWLHHRETLLRLHALLKATGARSFDCFQTKQLEIPEFQLPPNKSLRQLEVDLDSWFESRARGRGTQVTIFPEEHEVFFSIRHGHLFRREECLDDGKFGMVGYRPVQSDTVIFDRRLGELRINASTKKEKLLYRRLIGKHIFGDPEFFPLGDKYTLEALREYGEAALSCGDFEEIRGVRLTELSLFNGGIHNEVTIRKATDLFGLFELNQEDIPTEPRLAAATMKISLIGRRYEKTITLRPPNVAIYRRGNDGGVLDAWLEQRGFVKTSKNVNRDEPALVSA